MGTVDLAFPRGIIDPWLFVMTALMWACYKGHTEVVIELLKVGGVDVNIQSSNGYTALMMACVSNSLEVVIELLKVDGLKANLQSSDERTALV